MAKPRPEQELAEIEAVVRAHPGGITLGEIAAALKTAIPTRTLQHRLKALTDSGRLVREGERRWAKYRLPTIIATGNLQAGEVRLQAEVEVVIPLSKGGEEVRAYVRQPIEKRKPVGYDRAFLDSYRPNVSAYLTEEERAHLLAVGTAETGEQPAGTYAKQILNRLLIDLSWNSSRLEGNTYSLLDTKRLIDFGEEGARQGTARSADDPEPQGRDRIPRQLRR